MKPFPHHFFPKLQIIWSHLFKTSFSTPEYVDNWLSWVGQTGWMKRDISLELWFGGGISLDGCIQDIFKGLDFNHQESPVLALN